LFITLEGPDGGGKSSQIGPLAEFLRQAGYTVLTTREPGGTPIGDQVRQILLDPHNTDLHPRSEILLFQASRAQLVEQVIRPHLLAGALVISDRYADSTLAYQGYGQGGDLDTLHRLLDFATGGLKPDLTLLLDIDTERGIGRIASRKPGFKDGEWNRLDANALAYHQRVRAGYHELAQQEPGRWVWVDASLPPADVQQRLRAAILARLPKAPAGQPSDFNDHVGTEPPHTPAG
jgi:dTMP kinase